MDLLSMNLEISVGGDRKIMVRAKASNERLLYTLGQIT